MSSENQTKMSYTNYPISQGGDLYDMLNCLYPSIWLYMYHLHGSVVWVIRLVNIRS